MYNIVEKRHWFFLISALLIIPGVIAMVYSAITYEGNAPLRLGIDFTGGSLLELRFDNPIQPGDVRAVLDDFGFVGSTVQSVDANTVLARSKPMDPAEKVEVEQALTQRYGAVNELRFETVGPTVGAEVTRAAVWAVLAAAILIIAYIVIAFRKVPNAFRFGVCAVLSMLHDILVTLGLFSIAGLVLGWEADALFLTALLTVVSFSVQDTIVVFDRIRENVSKRRGESFETIVNRSLLETLHRSLATQLNSIFVLIALLLFGGATTRQFVAVLLVGLISGTYSSLFNAVPLLVVWETGKLIGRPSKAKAAA